MFVYGLTALIRETHQLQECCLKNTEAGFADEGGHKSVFPLMPRNFLQWQVRICTYSHLTTHSSTQTAPWNFLLQGLSAKVTGWEHLPPEPLQKSDWKGEMLLSRKSEEQHKDCASQTQ